MQTAVYGAFSTAMSISFRPIRSSVKEIKHAFSTSAHLQSGFLNLGARAMTRENMHFSKQAGASGKHYVEHSPSLQLLRSERDLAEGRVVKSSEAPKQATAPLTSGMSEASRSSEVFNKHEAVRRTAHEDELLSKLGIKSDLISQIVEQRVAAQTASRLHVQQRLVSQQQAAASQRETDEIRRLKIENEHLEDLLVLDAKRRSRARIRYFAFTFALLAGFSYAAVDWTRQQQLLQAETEKLLREARRRAAAASAGVASAVPKLKEKTTRPHSATPAPVAELVHERSVPTLNEQSTSWLNKIRRAGASIFWRQ